MIRILYERSGGFMGRVVRFESTLEELPPDQSEILKRLLDDADFFHLENPAPQADGMADGFCHSLMIEDGPISRSLQFNDPNIPEKIKPLLDELKARSRPQH